MIYRIVRRGREGGAALLLKDEPVGFAADFTKPTKRGYVSSTRTDPMTAADLESFRARMRWNRKRLGAELDISQDRLRRLLDGVQPIPRHIALACTALALGAPPMGTRND